MIIDLQTRVWSSPEQLGREMSTRLRELETELGTTTDASLAAHAEAMEPVDLSVVIGFSSARLGAAIPDEYVAEACRRHPGRIGISGIDPLAPGALDRLERAASMGLLGVCVSPAAQGFHPAHSQAMQVYERARELSMPVFVATPFPMTRSMQMEFARPAAWDEVARAFPDLPLMIGGLGHPWVDETLLLLAKHDRVFSDISGVVARPWQLYNVLLDARSQGVMSKLFFGSGFPFGTPKQAIENLYGLGGFTQGTTLPSVPRTLVAGIVERDALACLGIESAAIRLGDGASSTGGATDRPAARPMTPPRDSVAEDGTDDA